MNYEFLKVDTHCHLGGSIPPEFVWKVVQSQKLWHLAENEDEVYKAMTFAPTERKDFHRFLDKFRILDHLKWTEELIDESIAAVCNNLHQNRIDYCWMDFSINKYLDAGIKWHKYEIIQHIYDAFQRYRPGGVGLILSLKYESMKASQRQYAKLIEHEIASKCLIGLDLVGDEGHFDADFYAPLFKDWNAAGKITRAHVGESQGHENIGYAIQKLGVTNVAHGFKVIHNPDALAIAKERGVTFDLAITSNDITGVWPLDQQHPGVLMDRLGLKCTLGSDDPVQCSTTLDKEFEIAPTVGFSPEQLDRMRKTAIENSRVFLISP